MGPIVHCNTGPEEEIGGAKPTFVEEIAVEEGQASKREGGVGEDIQVIDVRGIKTKEVNRPT